MRWSWSRVWAKSQWAEQELHCQQNQRLSIGCSQMISQTFSIRTLSQKIRLIPSIYFQQTFWIWLESAFIFNAEKENSTVQYISILQVIHPRKLPTHKNQGLSAPTSYTLHNTLCNKDSVLTSIYFLGHLVWKLVKQSWNWACPKKSGAKQRARKWLPANC